MSTLSAPTHRALAREQSCSAGQGGLATRSLCLLTSTPPSARAVPWGRSPLRLRDLLPPDQLGPETPPLCTYVPVFLSQEQPRPSHAPWPAQTTGWRKRPSWAPSPGRGLVWLTGGRDVRITTTGAGGRCSPTRAGGRLACRSCDNTHGGPWGSGDEEPREIFSEEALVTVCLRES